MSNVTITIKSNLRAQIEGDYDSQALDDLLSFRKSQFWWKCRAAQMGLWDGKTRLFDAAGGTFPLGLLRKVRDWLTEQGVNVSIVDPRPPLPAPPKELPALEGATLRPYQERAVRRALRHGRGIVHAATGSGKCLAPWVPVMQYSGRRIRAGSVRVGDKLLGPDGKPRTVTSVTTGTDTMYEIRANRGDARFVCNSAHVLTIYDPQQASVVDVPLHDFLSWNKDRRRLARLVYAGEVAFARAQTPCPVDPWLLGLWYADGRKDLAFIEITKPDHKIVQAIRHRVEPEGYQVTAYRGPKGDRCPQWRITTPRGKPNPLLQCIRDLYGNGDKLPQRYLRGSIAERRAFLAGLLDGDGSSDGTAIEIIFKQRSWAMDLRFLARSLGFRTKLTRKAVRLPQWECSRDYWRVTLSGDTSQLPLKLKRKHAHAPSQTGFSVTRLGHGSYAGFTLSGDGRFVLGNFLVTHNTEVAIALVKALGQPVTLFLTGRIKLVRQTRERFATRLGCDLNDIGIIQGGKWIESPLGIYVATVSSLMSRKFETQRKQLFKNCELLVIDECHHAASTSWYRVALSCKARRRIGLTGTPKGRSDGADLMLEAATGPVIARVRAQELIDKGVLARPRIFLTRVTTPQVVTTEWKTARDRGIVENAYRNQLIANYAAQGQSMGLKGLILVHHIKQGWILHRMLPNSRFVYGHTLDCQVDRAVEALQEGSIKTLIASSIFQEGVDIPCVNLLIMASGGKSPIEILQKIGRGMRRKEDDNTLLVLDFWDDTHHYLRRHSSERKKIYEAENFEVKVLEGPQQLIHLKSTPQKA